MLFDGTLYQIPSLDGINWPQTKKDLGSLLLSYKISRERVALPALPGITLIGDLKKDTLNFDPFTPTNYIEDYQSFDTLFRHGFTAIMHPFQPFVTERRRKIFYYRYLYGMSIWMVSDKINYQKNTIIEESKFAILQFMFSLDSLSTK